MKAALKDFVEVWLHYDHKTKGAENTARQVELMGFNANPYWVIYDPESGKTQRKQAFTMSVEVFLKFLRGE